MFRSHMHIPGNGLLRAPSTGHLSTASPPAAWEGSAGRKDFPGVAILGALFYHTCMFADVLKEEY